MKQLTLRDGKTLFCVWIYREGPKMVPRAAEDDLEETDPDDAEVVSFVAKVTILNEKQLKLITSILQKICIERVDAVRIFRKNIKNVAINFMRKK